MERFREFAPGADRAEALVEQHEWLSFRIAANLYRFEVQSVDAEIELEATRHVASCDDAGAPR